MGISDHAHEGHPAPEGPETTPEHSQSTAAPSRIVVVEDDDDVRDLLSSFLSDEGYQVDAFAAGRPALAHVQRQPPDLVLLDIWLPDIDGYQICREIMERLGAAAPPVIFLTARTETAARVAGLDAGAVDYIPKPFEIDEVVARVRAALRSKAVRDALAAQAATDPLTGLLNRGQLDARAVEALALARRHGRPLAVLMVDIDHFKRINDTYGHQAGDATLREVARRIRRVSRASDIVGRYGGEEFVLLLPETDADGALAMAEKIRREIGTWPIVLSDVLPPTAPTTLEAGAAAAQASAGRREVRIQVSVGVACATAQMLDPAALYAAADRALYRAKAAGRNRVVLDQPDEHR